MKYYVWCVILLCALAPSASAQTQQPFVFTALGGLFFPANPGFQEVYQTSSDILWGGGMSVPIGGPFYIMTDIGFFRAETFRGEADTSVVLTERFIHTGILGKYHLTEGFFLRMSAGFGYSAISQKSSSSTTPEVTRDADTKVGYYGGVGLEQFLDPHFSLFTDVVYDYRRSRSPDLPGDFGGTRLVAGVNLILF